MTPSNIHSLSGKQIWLLFKWVISPETNDSVPAFLSIITVWFPYINPSTDNFNNNTAPDNNLVYSFHSVDYSQNTSIWNKDLDTLYVEAKSASLL